MGQPLSSEELQDLRNTPHMRAAREARNEVKILEHLANNASNIALSQSLLRAEIRQAVQESEKAIRAEIHELRDVIALQNLEITLANLTADTANSEAEIANTK